MFANSSMPGVDFAMPDVCLTPIPTPVGPVPAPIPYPNMTVRAMALPPTSSMKHLIMFMPIRLIRKFKCVYFSKQINFQDIVIRDYSGSEAVHGVLTGFPAKPAEVSEQGYRHCPPTLRYGWK